ncbi:SMI1/KNR4 family protein [Limnoglobus roseus]|uniref:Knr4/Smi1-like domain-containing protein n=1 Tax=Limnoglobus roseus TaxID=2598579 RepID=A0A5C1AEM9_9BACT|nr:SMI1/KNR4 family protein [Limnoglobus roseus]QEL15488.1 hypothetical protein PX52LOC_02411 [Limnoglobus roseus]
MIRLVTSEDAFSLLEVLPRCAGLTDDEIDGCEAACGVPFAPDFRRLLRAAGGSLGWLFPRGLDHPSQIGRLRAEAAELFAESGWSPGPTDIILFIHEQGCGAALIRGDGPVSTVYRYTEWVAGPENSGLTLGLYLATALTRHLSPDSLPR